MNRRLIKIKKTNPRPVNPTGNIREEKRNASFSVSKPEPSVQVGSGLGRPVQTKEEMNKILVDNFGIEIPVLQGMLALGVDINVTNDVGFNVLMTSIGKNNAGRWPENDKMRVKFLVENGANVNSFTKDGTTVLMLLAKRGGTVEEAEYLIRQGAKVDRTDDIGTTALMYASGGYGVENPALIYLLFKHGADLNATLNNSRVTALHDAVIAKNFFAVESLLRMGAKPNLKTSNGETALDLAGRFSRIGKKLKEYGAVRG